MKEGIKMLLTRKQLKEKGLSEKSLRYFDASGIEIYETFLYDVDYKGNTIFTAQTIEKLNKFMEIMQDISVANGLDSEEKRNPLVISSYYLDQFAEGYTKFLKWCKKGFMDYDEKHGVFLQSKYFLATFANYRTEDVGCEYQRLSVTRNGVEFFCIHFKENEE